MNSKNIAKNLPGTDLARNNKIINKLFLKTTNNSVGIPYFRAAYGKSYVSSWYFGLLSSIKYEEEIMTGNDVHPKDREDFIKEYGENGNYSKQYFLDSITVIEDFLTKNKCTLVNAILKLLDAPMQNTNIIDRFSMIKLFFPEYFAEIDTDEARKQIEEKIVYYSKTQKGKESEVENNVYLYVNFASYFNWHELLLKPELISKENRLDGYLFGTKRLEELFTTSQIKKFCSLISEYLK